jgi:tRNA threonylcarbamoyladenosine biosynthesis protein TsaE
MIKKKIQITTTTAKHTQDLGCRIGSLIQSATIIALSGDLGSGKTTLIQGISAGLDVPAEYYITSPTYTLINQYPGRLPLFHVDLYRIENPESLHDIGLYDILQENAVIAIEWAERLDRGALTEYIFIEMAFVDDDSRKLILNAYGLKEKDLLKKLSS